MLELIFNKPRNFKDDILSGLTVALALVPEAVAFAFVAGVDPLVGLYAAFIMGLITAAFGGRPGMISGATGAMAVVMPAIVILYGIEYLFAAVICAGLFQVLAGILKLGKFVRLLPHPVMLGFVNGLAIVIGKAQFGQFQSDHEVVFDEISNSFLVLGKNLPFTSPELLTMIGLIVLTMAISHFLPKITRAIPAPLVAIIICTLLVAFTPLSSKTVVDVVNEQRALQTEKNAKNIELNQIKNQLNPIDLKQKGQEIAKRELSKSEKENDDSPQGLKAELPTFSIPDIDWKNWAALKMIIFLGLTLASIGLIESLMTLTLVDELTETRGQGNRECLAQGAGNILSGFFQSMGGCAMIGQSMININSGGRGRTSGISAALFLFAFILFAPEYIGMIPVASLIGVMFMVVLATFEWSSLRLFGKVPKSDIFVIIAVSAITVLVDLAIAVGAGIIITALVFAWNHAKDLRLEKDESQSDKNTITYNLFGNIFFGSTNNFKELFNVKDDPNDVYLSFKNARVYDHSGLEAIHSLSEKYKSSEKKLHLKHLSIECSELLKKAGDLVEVNIVEDPNYHIATDTLA